MTELSAIRFVVFDFDGVFTDNPDIGVAARRSMRR